NSGQCLDVPGASRNAGIQIQQYPIRLGVLNPPDADANQLWQIEIAPIYHAADARKITNVHSNLVLDVRDSRVGDNGIIQQDVSDDEYNQRWHFRPVDGAWTIAALLPDGEASNQ